MRTLPKLVVDSLESAKLCGADPSNVHQTRNMLVTIGLGAASDWIGAHLEDYRAAVVEGYTAEDEVPTQEPDANEPEDAPQPEGEFRLTDQVIDEFRALADEYHSAMDEVIGEVKAASADLSEVSAAKPDEPVSAKPKRKKAQ